MADNEKTDIEKLQDGLDYLSQTKNLIKQAIVGKGQTISNNTPFREYAQKISDIETGIDTSDATATAQDILEDKTAYVNGQKVTGLYVPLDTSDANATTNDIMDGKTAYVNGQKVTGDYIPLNTSDATATVNDILKDKTAYVNGQKITGILEVGGSGEADVNFYDYDGTIIDSYTKAEFLALDSLPTNPSHTGLVAQGWNWTLSDAKTFVTSYNKLDIGQMYTTSSGLSEFDIELTSATGLQVRVNISGNKDWGDGTSGTSSTHTYSDYGKYTISCYGTSISSSDSSGLFGQSSVNYNYYVINARLTNISTISGYAFNSCKSLQTIIISNNAVDFKVSIFNQCTALKAIVIPNSALYLNGGLFKQCYSLKTVVFPNTFDSIETQMFSQCTALESIVLPNTITSIGVQTFSGCFNLKNIIIPNIITSIDDNAFNVCYSLKNVVLPNSVTSIGSYAFYGCYQLKSIVLSSTLTSIGTYAFQNCNILENIVLSDVLTNIGNLAFSNCESILVFDFSNYSSIPTLGNVAFNAINKLAKIVVPDSLYETWIVATNWSTYASYIVKASEYNQ